MTRLILWFRNDLRLHDNGIINYAMKFKSHQKEIVPVYTFDPRIFQDKALHHVEDKFDVKKTGLVRARFIHEAVANLR